MKSLNWFLILIKIVVYRSLLEKSSKNIGNSFLKILFDDMEKQLNLILEELVHISFMVRFFKYSVNSRDMTINKEKNCDYIQVFDKLNEFVKSIFIDLYGNNGESKENGILFLWSKIKETKLETLDEKEFNDIANKDKAIYLFKDFISVKNKIDLSLLNKFDFIQRKLLSYQNGYQNYYPSPKITSIKEATKIHFFMEKITSEFYDLIVKSKDYKDRTLFYWDYGSEILFRMNIKNFLVINTDFSLPYRQPHWIILLHEVLHHFLISLNNDNDIDYEFKEIMNDMEENISRATNDCRLALIKSNIKSDIDFNVISDVFIDSLLTYTLGIKYLLPVSVRLFAYDEDNFSFPNRDRWIIRLKLIIEIFKIKERDKYKEFINNIEKLIKYYLNLQMKFTNEIIKEDFFVMESVIEKTVLYRVKEFIKQHSKAINNEFMNLDFEKHKFLSSYLQYCEAFSDRYLDLVLNEKENDDKKEGRAICYTFQMLCDSKINNEKEVSNLIEKGFDLDVFRFTLFKLRFDSFNEDSNQTTSLGDGSSENQFFFKRLFEDWKHYCDSKDSLKDSYGNSFVLLSPFTMMVIDKDNVHQKKHAFDKRNDIEKLLRKALRLEGKDKFADESKYSKKSKEKETPYSYAFADFLLGENGGKYYFYKEELTLTLFETESEKREELNNILGRNENGKSEIKATDSVAILIKIRRKHKKGTQVKVEDLRNKILDSINNNMSKKATFKSKVFIFSSFDWFDYCALIFISPEKGENGDSSINLAEILQDLKRNFILNNENISRTETVIGVGMNIIEKVKIPDVAVLLRMSGEKLGEGYKFIDRCIEKNEEDFVLSSSFGIRDFIVQMTGEKKSVKDLFDKIDKILKKSSEKSISFSDIQIEPYLNWIRKQ